MRRASLWVAGLAAFALTLWVGYVLDGWRVRHHMRDASQSPPAPPVMHGLRLIEIEIREPGTGAWYRYRDDGQGLRPVEDGR